MSNTLITLLNNNNNSQLLLNDLNNNSGFKKDFGLFMAGDNGKALLNVSLEDLKQISNKLNQIISDIELSKQKEDEKPVYYFIRFIYNKKDLITKNTSIEIKDFYEIIKKIFNELNKVPVSTRLILDFIDLYFSEETNNSIKFSEITHVVEILLDDYDQLSFKTKTFLDGIAIKIEKLSS